ncbi:50S ribosomal protein L5 [Spiribacter salinus M19-40]|jgi:large subunit ribosomal protein L5|uniref:Large ribosomal subunit protein uL5 n=1 Tax=Spiribacter salinus M19-40 TaxID=1260251 RepID=R4VM96_9GAMM|nr:50S ribosomal protein L5 [Spiribacter salinus]AGM41577.1 50S ribosomal protein L5 [Spiribacter salinus M19-40]MBY5269167.1 50S ribosomal protein L5 [Spiribacter salinus]MDR9414147.1 50S ribosomal protein L5 [Spiribacter sp.]MDR9454589.1 50S ribosomal protein L5 [Spiribacter sp.]
MARLREQYKNEIVSTLTKRFEYANPMQVPRLEKVVLNMGLGEAVRDKKVIDHATADMAALAGQRPIVTYTRKAVAGFKIREDWPIGVKVTLRRERMYEFMDRLINIAGPRIRDFRGFSPRSFDGRGNYNLGVREQLVFPELEFDKIDAIRGMDIAIGTTAETDEEAMALLEGFGFPFRK